MTATATSFQLRSLAPVLIVDSVEPCLDFWVDKLAFTKENEVPGPDGKVVFASVITVPSVADLDAIEPRVKNAPSVKPRHETFYGSIEFYVREPGGNVVGFAAFK